MSTHTRRTFLKVSGTVLGGIAAGTTVTAAESADRFVVKKPRRGNLRGVEIVHDLPQVGLAVVRGSERAVRRSTKRYAPDIVIELDEPSPNAAAPTLEESATDEPLYDLQWDKQTLSIPDAHAVTRGEGTRVSVIDSGVLETHPDLAGPLNVDLSLNFTDDGEDHNPVGSDHGTHVAGIVAADDTNETGVVGTAPGTDLVDCRVFSGPFATFADILAAIVYSAAPTDETLVVNGEEVSGIDGDAANLSLGAYPVDRRGNGQFYGKVLNSTTAYANRQGLLLCIAAGNDSADLQHDGRVCVEDEDTGEVECFPAISLPNEAANVLSISATGPIGFGWPINDLNGNGMFDGIAELEDPIDLEMPYYSPAFYTNYGTNAIDLGAPGGDADVDVIALPPDERPAGWFLDLVFNAAVIFDTDGDGEPDAKIPTYGWKAGTSMAAPQVTGAVALVRSVHPDYNANQVESALERAASVPDEYGKEFYGSGFLNILDAL